MSANLTDLPTATVAVNEFDVDLDSFGEFAIAVGRFKAKLKGNVLTYPSKNLYLRYLIELFVGPTITMCQVVHSPR